MAGYVFGCSGTASRPTFLSTAVISSMVRAVLGFVAAASMADELVVDREDMRENARIWVKGEVVVLRVCVGRRF